MAMFGSSIGGGEILLILVVVLLLFGSERLPSIARSLGRAMEELRRAAHDLTRDVTANHSLLAHHPPSSPQPPDTKPEDKQG